MGFDNNYVTVDLDAITHNITAAAQKAGVPVMAVIKADGYGHGAVPIARHLEGKCAFFGVSSFSEAIELRKADIATPILILGHTPTAAFGPMIENSIRPTIFTWEDAKAFSDEAVKQGKTAPFHIAVDTGMSRIGFQVTEESADLCAEAAQLPGVFAEGLFSHYATADASDLTRAKAQAEQYACFLEMLRQRGITVPICHLSNSAGIMNFSNSYNMVRAGIITYGLMPSDEVDPALLDIKPALRWCSRVAHIKLLPAGRQISYGGTYTTNAPTRVATVSVGYADGYCRTLSGKFHVLIHGQAAPILGRVCMDQIMVDVTDIPQAAEGDEVVLVGRSGDLQITAEQISEAAGVFHYEFLCGIGRRVPRYYLHQGRIVHSVNYLL